MPFLRRLASARPGAIEWFGGALLWGAVMAAAAWCGFALQQSIPVTRNDELMLLYFAGGALAWLAVLPKIRFCALARRPETRVAAALLFLALGTVAMTALLFALQYRLFYARWHEPFGTRIWLYQFAFTSAGAVYQFAVLGIRPLLPFGGPLLLAASLLLARRYR